MGNHPSSKTCWARYQRVVIPEGLNHLTPGKWVYQFNRKIMPIPSDGYTLSSPLVFEHLLGVGHNAPALRYDGPRKCIYCGCTEYAPNATRQLGEEHIINGALGSHLILPFASCQKHEKLTSGIETRVIPGMFDPLRKKLGIKTRDRKLIRKGNFPLTTFVDKKQVHQMVRIADHPAIAALPILAPPGILVDRPAEHHGVVGTWLFNLNATQENIKKHGAFASPTIDALLFAQMIAKIAHAFASAEVLNENFEPFLSDFLSSTIDEDYRRYHLIGGLEEKFESSQGLHELAIGTHQKGEDLFLIVCVRLFAILGAPEYYVVVGKVPQSRRVAAMARLSNSNSRMHAR